jgi:predicted nucleic acid-binding protein
VTAVFLDTVGLLALWDRSDQWHGPAARVFTDLARRDVGLVTTTYVLAECANAAARKPYRTDVDDLRETLNADGALIVPSEDEWDAAWAAYRRGEAGQAGLVDHLSFEVMRRLGLVEAFTNDRHFRAAGFRPLF